MINFVKIDLRNLTDRERLRLATLLAQTGGRRDAGPRIGAVLDAAAVGVARTLSATDREDMP